MTIHTGAAGPYDATAAAKAADATPLKRPENGVFRPGTDFKEFYLTETGDTSTDSTLPGAYGGVFRLTQSSPTADTGSVSIVAVGDRQHTGYDNISFLTARKLLMVEDAGDGLQRNGTRWTPGTSTRCTSTPRAEHRRPAQLELFWTQ